MEPVSAIFLLVTAISRLASTLNRMDKEEARNAVAKKAQTLRNKVENASKSAKWASAQLLDDIVSYDRSLLRRVVSLSRNLPPSAFSVEELIGRTIEELDEIIRTAEDACKLTPQIVENDINFVSIGVLSLQGIEAIDKFGIYHIGPLHETLSGFVANMPFDGAADAAGHLGFMADITFGSFLDTFTGIYSAWRIFDNLSRAEKATDDAKDIENWMADHQKMLGYFQRLLSVTRLRHEELEQDGYTLFKWAWMAEQCAEMDTSDPRVFAGMQRSFVRFWQTLTKPVVTQSMSAT